MKFSTARETTIPFPPRVDDNGIFTISEIPSTSSFQKNDDLINLITKYGVSSLTIDGPSGITRVSLVSVEEEIRRTVKMHKKAFLFFSLFGCIGIISSTVFLTLGLSNVVSIFASIFGIVISLAFTLGVAIDFKRWEKRHV